MNRQAATMANPAVAAQIHQALDVHADFTTKITFNRELGYGCTQPVNFRLGQLFDFDVRCHTGLVTNRLGASRADAINRLQCDHCMLVGWYVDACNTRHALTPVNCLRGPKKAREFTEKLD